MIGVIIDVGNTSSIQLKDGSQRAKRDLVVGDETNVSIGITLWGDVCESQNFEVGKIIALKGCRVNDYRGKSLNASSEPQDISLNIKHKRTDELTRWQEGKTVDGMKRDMKALTGEGNRES